MMNDELQIHQAEQNQPKPSSAAVETSQGQNKPAQSQQQQPSDKEVVKATVYQSGRKPFTQEQAQYRENIRRKRVCLERLFVCYTP